MRGVRVADRYNRAMPRRWTVSALSVLAVILIAVLLRLRGPSPPATAPQRAFSATRASEILSDLLREQRPHPVGSAPNSLVRDRIAQRFRDLGYSVSIQSRFVCNAQFTCATVDNIVALPAAERNLVVLAAHYDSVPAGPGASDDGMGVATLLEVARAVRGERHRNPIGFLVTDGEEAGLLGAEAFVADEDLRRKAAVVVNVDNRGTSGPSFLFETSAKNGNLIRAARAVDRLYASSLFYTIYDLLPNDTDVTVFKRAGLQALNFAAIGNVGLYHTSRDDLSHADLRTLQHHGDNALAAARGLADGNLARSGTNTVYFDLLGFVLVSWPEPITIWIALASAVILAVAVRGASWKGILAGLGVFFAAIVFAAIVAFVLTAIAHIRAGEVRRLAWPHAVITAMWLAGAASAFAASAPASRSLNRRDLFLGVAMAWHIVAVALAIAVPGVAFLFIIPALAMAICSLARFDVNVSALIAASVAAVLFFPVASMIYTALAKTSLVGTAVVITLIATLFVSGSRWLAIGTFAAALVAAGATNFFPIYSELQPKRSPLTHELKSPTVELWAARSGPRLLTRVRSTRAADQVIVKFSREVEVLQINGARPAERNPRHRRRSQTVTVYGKSAVIEARVPYPVEVSAWDLSYGVPEAVLRTRPGDQVASQRGDVTVSTRLADY